ncbi:uncharacterized protein V1518DRAFT_429157 [Limtongia smithiae]|uniref:uncharacterized protein n=1 Tax=Limtongia smithiae TaxID=1125753 RepID=UPI0034CE5A6D
MYDTAPQSALASASPVLQRALRGSSLDDYLLPDPWTAANGTIAASPTSGLGIFVSPAGSGALLHSGHSAATAFSPDPPKRALAPSAPQLVVPAARPLKRRRSQRPPPTPSSPAGPAPALSRSPVSPNDAHSSSLPATPVSASVFFRISDSGQAIVERRDSSPTTCLIDDSAVAHHHRTHSRRNRQRNPSGHSVVVSSPSQASDSDSNVSEAETDIFDPATESLHRNDARLALAKALRRQQALLQQQRERKASKDQQRAAARAEHKRPHRKLKRHASSADISRADVMPELQHRYSVPHAEIGGVPLAATMSMPATLHPSSARRVVSAPQYLPDPHFYALPQLAPYAGTPPHIQIVMQQQQQQQYVEQMHRVANLRNVQHQQMLAHAQLQRATVHPEQPASQSLLTTPSKGSTASEPSSQEPLKRKRGRPPKRPLSAQQQQQQQQQPLLSLTDSPRDEGVTRCVCGAKEWYGDPMIQCDACKSWLHMACVGLDPRQQIIGVWYCTFCVHHTYSGV